MAKIRFTIVIKDEEIKARRKYAPSCKIVESKKRYNRKKEKHALRNARLYKKSPGESSGFIYLYPFIFWYNYIPGIQSLLIPH